LKVLWTAEWMLRKRCADRDDLNRCILRSRRRTRSVAAVPKSAIAAEHAGADDDGVEGRTPIVDRFVPRVADEPTQNVERHRCPLYVRRRLYRLASVGEAVQWHDHVP
jgi:hypothetical protein